MQVLRHGFLHADPHSGSPPFLSPHSEAIAMLAAVSGTLTCSCRAGNLAVSSEGTARSTPEQNGIEQQLCLLCTLGLPAPCPCNTDR